MIVKYKRRMRGPSLKIQNLIKLYTNISLLFNKVKNEGVSTDLRQLLKNLPKSNVESLKQVPRSY